MDERESIVLVHGLWMKGFEMRLLQWRLRRAGYRVYRFSYRSVARDLIENARHLNIFLQKVEGETVHFVAHSLGGLVVRRLLHDFPEQRPGRIVTLGTPHIGSYVANRLSRMGWFRRLLGYSFPSLKGELSPWHGERQLGSIAGDLSIGIGQVVRSLPRPNDGTVSVVETQLERMSDHVVLHASHMALLFSQQAAEQTIHFLRNGVFEHDITSSLTQGY
jgi:pimeloyl-ACP methyl ester carboxylesterase